MVVIPESFGFDQYARENNSVSEFGITITGVTLPPVIGKAERNKTMTRVFHRQLFMEK